MGQEGNGAQVVYLQGEHCPPYVQRTAAEIQEEVEWTCKLFRVENRPIELVIGGPPPWWVDRAGEKIIFGTTEDLDLPWVAMWIGGDEPHKRDNTDPLHTARHECAHIADAQGEEYRVEVMAMLARRIRELEHENTALRERTVAHGHDSGGGGGDR